MNHALIEPLENRRLLSAGPITAAAISSSLTEFFAPVEEELLSAEDVAAILAAAGSKAATTQAIAVVDREGIVLGIFGRGGLDLLGADVRDEIINQAVVRARTAALFQSSENAFTTRTARFIIQDHFPPGVRFTPGGPLYGVQFSSLPGSDVIAADRAPAVSGDPGGVPLYKNRKPVGGIGVAGDFHDIAPRENLLNPSNPYQALANPTGRFFVSREERDMDEAVAIAGAKNYATPQRIRSNRVFLDGLRLPFTKTRAARGPSFSLDQLIAMDLGSLRAAPTQGKPTADIVAAVQPPYPSTVISGFTGQLKRRDLLADPDPNVQNFGIIDSDDAIPQRLTQQDVIDIFSDAVSRALITRAAIRKPIGVHARVHIAVVDRDGDLLGVFRMADGTNFSYDVAVQKARTAAFFSDDTHAFSTRAIGFASQKFFPVGLDNRSTGPFFEVQNALSLKLQAANMNPDNPLPNGITIFPGGVPLYREGVLVGAVGISGDGVDQDDIISFSGATRFLPDELIRSDALPRAQIIPFLVQRAQDIENLFDLDDATDSIVAQRFEEGFEDFRLPFVKFPRNPRR